MKGYHVTQLLNQYGDKNPTDASRFPVHYQPSKLKPTASPVKKNESNVTFSGYIIRPGPGNVLRIHPVQLGVLVANCTNPLASSMWKVRFDLPPSIQLLRRHSRVGQLGQWACLLTARNRAAQPRTGICASHWLQIPVIMIRFQRLPACL